MKKLNTNNTGRMPLWQADLEWIQQAYTGPIEAIIKELGMLSASYSRPFFPVTGCRVSINNGNISMSEGWFWWDGELLPVRALEATSTTGFTNPAVHLSRVSYNDPNGLRNFIQADQSTELVEDVWQDDYIEPSVVERWEDHQPGITILPGAWTLYEFIKRRNEVFESEWITLSGLNNPENMSFKQIGRTVVLRGRVFLKTDGTPVVTGLPVPLVGPAYLITGKKKYVNQAQHIGHNYYDNSVATTEDGELYAWINDEGELIVQQTDGDTDELVNFTGMTYIAAEPYQESLIDMNVIVNL